MKDAFLPATKIDPVLYKKFKTILEKEDKQISDTLRDFVDKYVNKYFKKGKAKEDERLDIEEFIIKGKLPFDSSDDLDKLRFASK